MIGESVLHPKRAGRKIGEKLSLKGPCFSGKMAKLM
jgi:hypothetical protein